MKKIIIYTFRGGGIHHFWNDF